VANGEWRVPLFAIRLDQNDSAAASVNSAAICADDRPSWAPSAAIWALLDCSAVAYSQKA